MRKIIVECPKCSQQLRIPGDKNIKFKCSRCQTELYHNPAEVVEASDVEIEDDFKPSSLRMVVHAIVGGFIGAPIGAAVVGAIAAILGSLIGYFSHFWETLTPFEILDIITKSINVIGEGASQLAVEWIPYGAKIGPWVFAILGLLLSTERWEKSNSNK